MGWTARDLTINTSAIVGFEAHTTHENGDESSLDPGAVQRGQQQEGNGANEGKEPSLAVRWRQSHHKSHLTKDGGRQHLVNINIAILQHDQRRFWHGGLENMQIPKEIQH